MRPPAYRTASGRRVVEAMSSATASTAVTGRVAVRPAVGGIGGVGVSRCRSAQVSVADGLPVPASASTSVVSSGAGTVVRRRARAGGVVPRGVSRCPAADGRRHRTLLSRGLPRSMGSGRPRRKPPVGAPGRSVKGRFCSTGARPGGRRGDLLIRSRSAARPLLTRVTVHGEPSPVLLATRDLESLEETIEIRRRRHAAAARLRGRAQPRRGSGPRRAGRSHGPTSTAAVTDDQGSSLLAITPTARRRLTEPPARSRGRGRL